MNQLHSFVKSIALTTGVALSLAVSAQSYAQNTPAPQPSPEALQAAQDLATLSTGSVVSELVTTMTNQVWPAVEAAIRVKNPIIDPVTLNELRKDFEQLQANAVRDVMIEGAPIYARYLTAAELREIIAFYKTPTGAKAIGIMPRASMELLQTVGPRLQALSDNVNRRFAAILQERGYKP